MIVAIDGALLVLDKPAGLPVHAAAGEGADLMSLAREALGAPEGLAPIQRLDKATSGLVLCSADAKLRAEVGRWLAEGAVRKQYLALVHGTTHHKGIVRRPLADARRGRALPATTRYRRLRALGPASFLRVVPATGRKHQIRRHLQGIGHAVVGDRRYPPRRFAPVPGFPGRLWLHCARLRLPDGREFVSPLPAALEEHLALLATLCHKEPL
jgi:23S rRNA-/tRNA-specific pseudouridylate synthase